MQASLPLSRHRLPFWTMPSRRTDPVWQFAGRTTEGQQTWRRDFVLRGHRTMSATVYQDPQSGVVHAVYATLLGTHRGVPRVPVKVQREVEDFTTRLASERL